MSISLTPEAAERVENFLAESGGAVGLRLGVEKTGCSGWAYVVDLADAVTEGDTVYEDRGVKVVIDRDALPLVDGTEIDFVTDGLNRVFRFRNPNVAEECGCGESFTVEAPG